MNGFTISGALFKNMVLFGGALLEQNKAYIDSLNVFPVPDGDTGTNMSMTMQSAMNEIMSLSDMENVSTVSAAASKGALKGARGNSGVILSQIFRGFSKAFKDSEEIDAALLVSGLKKATESAYKAVMKPKEGTILTVIRMISEAVEEAYNKNPKSTDISDLIDLMIESGEKALALTPDLLPVLKEAGVIDSGGKGLMTILSGFRLAFNGKSLDDIGDVSKLINAPAVKQSETSERDTSEDNFSFMNIEDIKYSYCTEFFVIHLVDGFKEEDLDSLRNKLMQIGDSVVVASDSDYIKVHVHTNVPGKALQLGQKYGELYKLKIENMLEQNRVAKAELKKSEKEYAMIAVSSGEGISSVFTDLGVNAIIEGGQTMNPSIDTISKQIRKVNARNVFIFPNNSNIIMAAQQAAKISDRNVIVIPTKTIVQGISSVMAFSPEASAEDNERYMTDAIAQVVSGAVTYAVRKTSFKGMDIEEGDIMGILDNDIVSVHKTVEESAYELLKAMIAKKSDDAMVTIFFGEDTTEEQAQALADKMQGEYPDAEFIVQNGGQSLYYYYFSVE